MNITITKRADDYHACLKDHPEIWGCGKNVDEAIGSLIRAHGDTFGVEIKEPTR